MSAPPSSTSALPASRTSLALRVAVFAALSWALGRATAPFALHEGLVPFLDPVVGLAVAAVIAFGPSFAIGAWIAASIGAAQAGPYGAGESLVLGLAPAFAALAAARILRGRRSSFGSLRDAGAYFLAAVCGGAVAAAWTASALAAFGHVPEEALLRPFATAWTGATSGALLVGGALLSARGAPRVEAEPRSRAVLVLALVAAAGIAAFASLEHFTQPMQRVIVLAALPLVFAAGARGGARAASSFALVFGSVALFMAARDLGPFRAMGAGSGPFLAAIFASTLAVVGLSAAALATRALRAEADARARREQFDLAVGDAAGGLWEWDLVGDRVWFSARFLLLLGMEPVALERRGDALSALVHPEDHPVFEAAVREQLERGAPYEVDVRLLLASGGHRWFLVRGFAQRDAEGRPIRIAGSIGDASGRKAGESELARLENELAAARELAERRSGELALVVEELARVRGDASRTRMEPELQRETLPFDPPADRRAEPRGRARPRRLDVLLVVDGDERTLVRALERLECRVRVARNGNNALAELERAPAELVFVDCGLPGMDAYATALELRARADVRAVPIVALSDRARPGELATCIAAGMDDLVGRSADEGELAVALARWSSGRGVGLSLSR